MAKKSRLSDDVWSKILERVVNGEPVRALAREHSIAESVIRKRVGAQAAQIKTVVNQQVTAELTLKSMSMGAQHVARGRINFLVAVGETLAQAGLKNAESALLFATAAKIQAAKIDTENPLATESELKAAALLTRMSNDASTMPLALMTLHKDIMQDADKPAPRLTALRDDDFI